MIKTVIITARISFMTDVEGETMEEIEEKAEDILENQPLEDFVWDEGEYEIMEEEDEEVEQSTSF